MPLTSGSRIGAYEITGPIGAGGMGEVYRARDTTLNRDVALKVLPESFASDADRLMRFRREAQTLAALNHPNIAQVFGLEESGTTRALVMELVEGEDLSQRVARGSIPLDDALPIARQIAEALEAAHEQGIVHRDLKPANIKVRPDGVVKVLDFGLAKGSTGSTGSTGLENTPTITSPALTMHGVILGTAAYMSPEQARGKPVDKRADIWAFGVVVYEMLTGRKAFAGDEMSDVLAAVLRQPIDWAALPPETPSSIRRLLRRCLERDRAERLGDMSAARLEIKEALDGGAEAAIGELVMGTRQGKHGAWKRVSAGLAVVSIALAVALAMRLAPKPEVATGDAAVVRFALFDNRDLRVYLSTQPLATSRDGRTIVFSANDGTGAHLWVRTLDHAEPQMLADTEGAAQPSLSPDGEWVAFVVANHVIRKVRLSGGGATTVASVDDLTAALDWASNDRIIFEKIGSGSGIHQVSANGGPPELLIPLAADEMGQRRPVVLREQRLVLYASSVPEGGSRLAAFSLDDGRRSQLQIVGFQALGMIDDHLVYARGDGTLLAVPFDAPSLRVLGPPVQLDERVAAAQFGPAVTLSESGTLVFPPLVSPLARLMLADETGRAVRVGDSVRAFEAPRFSPDGHRIAVGIAESEGQALWILDRASAAATRVTRGGRDPNWTPDGKALIYSRGEELWTIPVDASAEPRKLVELGARILYGASVLPDGRGVVVSRRVRVDQGALDREEIVRVSLGAAADVVPIIASRSSGGMMRGINPRVSPDGRWVAIQDRNENQVHVRSLEGGAGVQVSDAGGDLPVWSHDSRRLFYQASAGPMVADLQTAPTLSVIRRQRLPDLPVASVIHDVSPDGKMLLLVVPVDPSPTVLVTVNWAASVRQKLRAR